MSNADIRNILMVYTQDAADAKGKVGKKLAVAIAAEPRRKKVKQPNRTWLRVAAVLVIAIPVFLSTAPGKAFADFIYENIIQRLFKPVQQEVILEGMPEDRMVYPSGEVVQSNSVGLASYVLYLEGEYTIVQEENLLTASYALAGWTQEEENRRREDFTGSDFSQIEIDALIEEQRNGYEKYVASLPRVSLEITQVVDTTVDEMVSSLQSKRQIGHIAEPETEFPYTSLHFSTGRDATSEVGSYYVRDNSHGGVFVITSTYFLEAAEGHGARFENAVKGLEIIDDVVAEMQ